jgi:hypothetical protein
MVRVALGVNAIKNLFTLPTCKWPRHLSISVSVAQRKRWSLYRAQRDAKNQEQEQGVPRAS